MANCIRCGKPCNNGETMCDECKAWFQEKTGGATIPGAKKVAGGALSSRNSSFGKKAQPVMKSENENSGNTTGPGDAPNGMGDTPVSENNYAQNNNSTNVDGKNISISPKMLGIAGIAAVAVIVVVVMVVSNVGKHKSSDEQYYAEDTINYYEDEVKDSDVYGEELDAPDVDDVVNDEADASSEAPVYVQNLLEKYSNQMDEYYENDSFEDTWVGLDYVVYLDDELVQVNPASVEGWGTQYYYYNGEVYYAANLNDAGECDQLFFEDGSLVYWIDYNGENHDEYEAFDNWGYTVDEAIEYYDMYQDKTSAGLGETSEYILPSSDCDYISKSDLESLSEWEVRVARNEIMARHGRRFNDQSLQDYFNSCTWYNGTVDPEDFDKNYESNLNEYEKKNATTIKEYEKEKGYNLNP